MQGAHVHSDTFFCVQTHTYLTMVCWFNLLMKVHNGKDYVPIEVKEAMIGGTVEPCNTLSNMTEWVGCMGMQGISLENSLRQESSQYTRRRIPVQGSG